MSNKIKFIEGITFESLNPHNFHLKNDYINNLLSTAFMILPSIADEVSTVKILKAFLSRSYLRSLDRDIVPAVYKHSIGLALEVTWADWDMTKALLVADKLFSEIEEGIKLVINTKNKSLFIGRGFKESSIVETTGSSSSERVIKNNNS